MKDQIFNLILDIVKFQDFTLRQTRAYIHGLMDRTGLSLLLGVDQDQDAQKEDEEYEYEDSSEEYEYEDSSEEDEEEE